jgi:hypothetical protein
VAAVLSGVVEGRDRLTSASGRPLAFRLRAGRRAVRGERRRSARQEKVSTVAGPVRRLVVARNLTAGRLTRGPRASSRAWAESAELPDMIAEKAMKPA